MFSSLMESIEFTGMIRRSSVKVGDLVKYYGNWNNWSEVGLVLYINDEGGTIKVHHNGKIKWWVTSGCEVVNGR